jgi:polygalacturonase
MVKSARSVRSGSQASRLPVALALAGAAFVAAGCSGGGPADDPGAPGNGPGLESGVATGSESGTGGGEAGANGEAGTSLLDSGSGMDSTSSSSTDSGGTPESGSTGGGPEAGGADVVIPPTTGCGAGDTNLPAEPTIPSACATLSASLTVASGGVPSESSLDTSRIQTALNSCGTGKALKLATNGASNAFITGPLTLPSGVTLWVDTGATLYGTRSPSVYGTAAGLITVKGANSGIVGGGVIDGQGGEPEIGATGSFWDANGNGGSSPALILVSAATNFTMYQITLHNAPMFHVKLDAAGFVVWGITIKTPSKTTNSAGTALTPTSAHNTDGVDPGEAASNGYIVCNSISDGDDHIAIKGGTSVNKLTIAHNHFGAGHGMSIGSETNGGVSNVNVYDLSIDGTGTGLSGGSSNGIRIKSDPSRGGLVTNVTYSDVCVRDLTNPILITPRYSTATGTLIPHYTDITISNFHSLSSSVTPKVTIEGYDAAHATGLTLDNVVIDGIASSDLTASYASVTEGPGAVNFTPTGTGVTVSDKISGTSTPNTCAGKWVTF